MTHAPGRLDALGLHHGTDKATFHGYCNFYEQHLPAHVDRLLEIGVMDGNSLRMWREYYPGASAIVGMDNRPVPAVPGADVWLGDATKPADLMAAGAFGAPWDVIIDDGSHMTQDQQDTFAYLWPAVRPGGVYVIEDLHTSFMSNYVTSSLTTVEFLAASTDLDVTMFGRPQGEPNGFLARHGFDTGAIEWLGADPAESITAIIRKPAKSE